MHVRVPKVTKAELTVSQNPNSSVRTNLVPGVTGVLCARSVDSRFGMPRVTLLPTVVNDTDTGQLLWTTDFLLARASGATNGTWTLNWRRWDSAYNARHGIPVPPGRTRIDVGIDFDFDGELSEEEIALSCDVCVLEGALVPDYDRNGEIDADDAEKAATNATLRFWVNNDKDNGDVSDEGTSIPGQSNSNFTDAIVNGRDDLVDFFPVWLDMGQILDAIPEDSGYTYRLRSSYANAVWTSLSRNEAGNYLTADIAGCGPQLNQNSYEATTTNLNVTWGTIIPDAFLNLIRSDPNKGVVLLEGRSAGSGTLTLNVCRGTVTVWTTNIAQRVSQVEDMYNHINLRPSGGLSTYTNTLSTLPFPNSEKTVVYLHGFRVGAQEAREWNAKMFKKLHQAGSNSRFCGITWWGDEIWMGSSGLNYHANAANAFAAAPNLATRMAAFPGKKVMIAHSLGNMMVSSAIADHNMSAERYIMLNAAIASEAFNGNLANEDPYEADNWLVHVGWQYYAPRTWTSTRYQLFLGLHDGLSGLTWRNRFANVRNRTTVFNYFDSEDEVFELLPGTPDALDGNNLNHHAWQKQELYKGRMGTDPLAGWAGTMETGWGFSTFGLFDSVPRLLPYTAHQANTASLDRLREDPVHLHYTSFMVFTNDFTGIGIDSYLSRGVPALSPAVGNTSVAVFGEESNNFDLAEKKQEWPQNRPNNKYEDRWQHSDIHNVAYRYTHKAFKDIVDKGGLK